MKKILWGTAAPVEHQRPALSEAMRNAEPKRPATEVMFSALDKAMTQFEHRKGVLEREIAERQTELSDLAVAMKAAGAGLSGLNSDRQLTERLADAVSAEDLANE
jgi:hypothetical protein